MNYEFWTLLIAILGSVWGGVAWIINKTDKDRSELKGDIDQVRQELKGDIDQVRQELKDDLDKVHKKLEGDIDKVRQELKGDIDKVATRLDVKEKDIRDEFKTELNKTASAVEDLKTEVRVLAIKGEERTKITNNLVDNFVSLVKAIKKVAPQLEFNYTMKASPRKLSPLGELVYEEIKGAAFLDENENTLFAYIDEAKPRTALDIEGTAYQACLSISSEPAFDYIKDYIYNRAPIEMEGKKTEVSVLGVCETLSIPLRDRYMAARGIQPPAFPAED